jgi:hypothetical protein
MADGVPAADTDDVVAEFAVTDILDVTNTVTFRACRVSS